METAIWIIIAVGAGIIGYVAAMAISKKTLNQRQDNNRRRTPGSRHHKGENTLKAKEEEMKNPR